MTVIEDIKDRLRIEDEIGAVVKLRRAGKNYTGMCPFHDNSHTPAFVVFPGTQSWKCFGQCNEGGDIFAFVMKKHGWDFKEALRALAEKAGVELRPMGPEEQKRVELQRARESVFGVAVGYFQQSLKSEMGKRGLAYAHYERCWPDDLLQDAGVGFFGKDWNGLREALTAAGIDLESPAAVALVGFRGDVLAWAKKHGVDVQAGHPWVDAKKVPAMPPDMLIYPHMVHGRVVTIAGRRLPLTPTPLPEGEGQQVSGEENYMPKSWNPPVELVGEKQPFFNQVWWGRKTAGDAAKDKKKTAEQHQVDAAVIVEGQGDAITLGHWDLMAVALVGDAIAGYPPRSPHFQKTKMEGGNQSNAGNFLLSELKRKAGAGLKIVVGLDNDEDGLKKRGQVVDDLMAAGLSVTQICVVTWPFKDANEWLTKGGTLKDAQQLVLLAQPVLGLMIDDAAPVSGTRDDDAVRKLFGALTKLTSFEVENVREEVCDRLQIRHRMFDGLLKAARRDAGQNDDGQARYFIEGGRIFARFYDAQGGESIDPLCNFAATIKEDVLRDNGQETVREFRIAGETGKMPLPEARVPADEFSKMDWVLKAWGSRTIIEAGSRRKDQLRAAIQHLSREVERRTIYTHTGWRSMSGKRIYLSAAGAVGAEGVDVELDQDLELYNIPATPDEAEGAMRLSLSFLDIAPDHISFPIWSAVWLPVMRELVNVAFVMWVFGGTGAMKSTYTALAMNHYGPGFDDKHLPANFLDTANRLEQKSFVVKDAVLVIDDYAPQKDARSHSDYVRAAARIIRAAGNLSGRGRLTADASARTTYVPRSLVVITGEDLIELEGLVARLFVVEMKRGDIDKEKLSALQNQRGRLSHAMSGFLLWAAEHWPGWTATIPAQWRAYRQRAFEDGIHLRLPEAVAGLMIGAEMGLRYASVLGVINGAEYAQLLERAWTAMTFGAKTMTDRVKDEKPEVLYLRTLGELITQGKVFFKPAGGLGAPLGGPNEHAEMLGWYDEDRLYLMPEATYNRISRYYRDQSNVFPVRESTLRKMLFEAGYIETDPGRRTMAVQLDNQPRRVMVLKRKHVEEEQ